MLEVRPGVPNLQLEPGHLAGQRQKLRPVGILGKLEGALVIVLRRGRRGKRRRVVTGFDERLASPGPDVLGVGGLSFGVVCLDEVRGEHLGHLLFLVPLRSPVGRRGEVAHLAVTARQRSVGDGADEVLQEHVLSRSGERGSDWMASSSLLTSPLSAGSIAVSGRRVIARSAPVVNDLPSTEASWRT